MEKKNSMQMPEIYYCRHIKAGLAGYEDEALYINTDTLKKMMPSFAGKPVYVYHQEVDVANLQEQADGYVTECFYNELDGWFWAKFIAVSDIAHAKIKRGWSVSNAYTILEQGMEGTEHNIPYDREVINGEYTHLAIVPNPRYENAQIFTVDEYKNYCKTLKTELEELKNSKDLKGGKLMFKLFTKKEVENTIDIENAIIQLEDGREVVLKDAIEVVANAKAEEDAEKAKKEDEKVNMDSEIEVGDEKMTIKELAEKYKNACNKKNEDDEKVKKDEEEKKKDEEKKNALESKEKEEKLNAIKKEEDENFKKLNDVKADSNIVVNTIETSGKQINRGKERYGSK